MRLEYNWTRSYRSKEMPVVRHFIACRSIVLAQDGSITLHDLVHAIRPSAEEDYPCIRDEMAIYALLTNGRGPHEFALELTRFDRGSEIRIVRTKGKQIDLGSDPLAVRGLPIPLRNVIFECPGQYTFHLLCDGVSIAEEKVLLRDST